MSADTNVAAATGRPDLPEPPTQRPLQPGTPAPDFTLARSPENVQRLADLRGQPVILVFYPLDWSPVCGDEVSLFNEVLPEFEQHNAQLLGISVDSVYCHQAFATARNLRFPLLADFEPKGAVARVYRAYREKDGFAERALFLIDGDGIVRWSYVSAVNVNPGADGLLTALESLSSSTARVGATS